jgi:arylsulfatase A-like enzyme
VPPPTLDVDPNDATVYAAAVPKYFELVGRWIGRYLDICPLDEYVVIMVSDHGFRWGNERPAGLSGTAGPIAPMWHARDAVFVVVGLGVEHLGEVATQPSVFDIVPTIADLLGIPPDPSWRTSVLPGVRPSTLTPVGWVALVPPASYRL